MASDPRKDAYVRDLADLHEKHQKLGTPGEVAAAALMQYAAMVLIARGCIDENIAANGAKIAFVAVRTSLQRGCLD